MRKEEITFSFGENWEEFVRKNFNQERIEISKKHILEFLELSDLSGKCFLDVGCGSGLSSLTALEAGAKMVVSFDVDSYSVKTTEKLRLLVKDERGFLQLEEIFRSISESIQQSRRLLKLAEKTGPSSLVIKLLDRVKENIEIANVMHGAALELMLALVTEKMTEDGLIKE